MQKKLDSEESLNLLREISANPRMTQREMSSRLNLSLGKINFLIKAMITLRFLKRKTEEYERLKEEILRLEKEAAVALSLIKYAPVIQRAELYQRGNKGKN